MNRFFHDLAKNNRLTERAEKLDWLFDESKFSPTEKWTPGRITRLTKRIQKIMYEYTEMEKGIQKCTDKGLDSLSIDKGHSCAYRTSPNSISRDFIRHIRNGIAHGHCTLYKKNKRYFVEIIDCKPAKKSNQASSGENKKDRNTTNPDDKTSTRKQETKEQWTAYFYWSIDVIFKIYDAYCKVKNSKLESKKQKAKGQKKNRKREKQILTATGTK